MSPCHPSTEHWLLAARLAISTSVPEDTGRHLLGGTAVPHQDLHRLAPGSASAASTLGQINLRSVHRSSLSGQLQQQVWTSPRTLPTISHRRVMLQVMLSSVSSETCAPGWAYSPALSYTLLSALAATVPASAVPASQGTWAFQGIPDAWSHPLPTCLVITAQGQPQRHFPPSCQHLCPMRILDAHSC